MSHRGLITSVAAMAVAAVMVTGVAQADGGGLVRSQMVACVHDGTVLGASISAARFGNLPKATYRWIAAGDCGSRSGAWF